MRNVFKFVLIPIGLPLLIGAGLVGLTLLGVMGLAVKWGDCFS